MGDSEPWIDDIRQTESNAFAPSLIPNTQTSPLRLQSSYSPTRVKAKPADPQVISDILTSLDALTPLPGISQTDQYSDSASRLSHPESSTKSIASSASAQRTFASPGFGVEYGTGLQLDDDEGVTDAALPPTIPTSRPASGFSHYSSKRPPAFSKTSGNAIFRTRPSSHRSSFSTTSERPGSNKKKLSSESWVRKNTDTEDTPTSLRGRTPRKSLRRVESQEMLRVSSPVLSPPLFQGYPAVSLAEQIIARTPPPLSTSKGRLYLTDTTINQDQSLADSPLSPTLVAPSFIPEQTQSYQSGFSPENKLAVAVTQTPPLQSPSPISDSIPTRTSSLRHPSISPASKKRKHKKSKKHLTSGKSAKMGGFRQSLSIPDSSWADLGEDDETVRRIIQLREQRKTRLQESTPFSMADVESLETSAEPTPVDELSTPNSDDNKITLPVRLASNRSATDPIKAHKVLIGLKNEQSPVQTETQVNGAKQADQGLNVNWPAKLSWDSRRPGSARNRPATSKSEHSAIQPDSLDYSYSEAVDALNDVNNLDQSSFSDLDSQSRKSTERKSLQLKGLDLQSSRNRIGLAPPTYKSSKKSKKGASPRAELPPNLERMKSRRKSMSDTRHARIVEQEELLARRGSIEDAVQEYLKAPRLTRTVHNPSTGRTIAFSEVGDPEGAAVFICVGMGLTRYITAFYDELATTLRLRLITMDRPGVGGSQPLPSSDKSGPLSWPEDVLAVCQHLGIIQFSLLAHSAGAIYALATALILPHLVKGKVHLLAPWVPPSQLEAISYPAASAPPANPLPRSQRFLRVLPTPFLKAANTSFMTATSASLKPATKRNGKSNNAWAPARKVPEPESPKRPMSNDRPEYNRRESMMLMDQFMPTTNPTENFPANLREEENEGEGSPSLKPNALMVSATATPTDPSFAFATDALNAAEHAEKQRQNEYSTRLTERTWELATRDSNPATDLVICLERTRDVGFRYTDVGREVVITHGSEDKRVPAANVKWLAEQMNRRTLGMTLGEDARESRESYLDGSAKGGCEVRILEGEGHGLMASPSIMSDILTEIAGYWVEKGRN